MGAKLPLMESFLSLQGEGYHQGLLSYFIRLAGCDVGCPWCDVKESWQVDSSQWVDIDEMVAKASDSPAKDVIITGGEPLMYDLTELTEKLRQKGMKLHIETSGAYPLSGDFDWITLSPKKFKKPLKEIYSKADELKVVIASKKDLEWAEEESSKVEANCLLYLQSEWERKDREYARIYSYIADHPKWKISIQSHKYLDLP